MAVCLPETLAVRKVDEADGPKQYHMQEAEPSLPSLEQVACQQGLPCYDPKISAAYLHILGHKQGP